jgi:6-phosphofructokinase
VDKLRNILFLILLFRGGHNVIFGLFEFLNKRNGKLYGFLMGIKGLLSNKYVEIKEDLINLYKNQGGFEMLGNLFYF